MKQIFSSILLILSVSLLLFSGCAEKNEQTKQDPSNQDIENSLNLATEWLIDNLEEEGKFIYVYDPAKKEYSSNNNMIRQLMSSRVLAELSKKNTHFQEKHKKNLKYIFSHWYKEKDEKGYIYFSQKSKLGATAMALRTLAYSPFYNEYKDKAEKLATTILSLQNEDGSFDPFLIEPTYTYDKDYLLTFYSGEAILSLVEYYEKTQNKKYLDAAIKSQDFYIKKYVDKLKENYYPAYVPWHTIALNKLYKITGGKQKYANAIFTLNDELLKIQNTNGKPRKEFLGRFYDPKFSQYGSPHSASDSVYTEGLAYAYEIAKIAKDETHKTKYKKALLLAIHNLISLQYKEENLTKIKHSERIKGALKYKYGDGRVRIDNTQHAIDALTKSLEVLK